MATLNEDFVFEYFSQLNPIAYKIQVEINQTIANYEHYWNDLDKSEQMTIINEAVIKPEIQLNYNQSSKQRSLPEQSHPYRDIDDSLLNYFLPKSDVDRPFSYKTRSQQNLFYSLCAPRVEAPASSITLPVAKPKNNQINKSTDSLTCVNFVNLNVKAVKKGRAPAVPVKMTKPPPPPPPTAVPKAHKPVEIPVVAVVSAINLPTPVTEDTPQILEDSHSNTSLLSPAEVEERKVILNPSLATENDDECKTLLDSNGFDFLNNW